MTTDLFQRVTLPRERTKDHSFDPTRDRYVVRKPFVTETGIQATARDWMRKPVPGVAILLGLEKEGKKTFGVFESLPGQSLDSWIMDRGTLSIPDWLEVAEQMVTLAVRLRKHPEVTVQWLPHEFHLWRENDGELRIALSQFSLGSPNTIPMREKHLVANLALTWHFLLTGESDEAFYGLSGRDFGLVGALQDFTPLIDCFDGLFAAEPELRTEGLAELRQELTEIREALDDLHVPSSGRIRINDRLSQSPGSGLALSSWEVPEDFTLSAESESDSRGSYSAIHDPSGREVRLHVVPKPSAQRVASRWQGAKAAMEEHLVSPVLGVYEAGGRVGVVAERHYSKAISLAELIGVSGGLDLPSAVVVLREIDEAISQAEQLGMERISMNVEDILLVPRGRLSISGEAWEEWTQDRQAFAIRLRPITTGGIRFAQPAGRGRTLADTLIDGLDVPPEQRRVLALAMRLIRIGIVCQPEVASVLLRGSKRRSSPGFVRHRLVHDLAGLLHADSEHRPRTVKTIARKLVREVVASAMLFSSGFLPLPQNDASPLRFPIFR